MSALAWIIVASLAGGVISACAAALALLARAAWVPMLVSFAIGTLLGAAFLEVIPHAFEHGGAQTAASAILGGILGFFLLEKLLLWRHSHEHEDHAHDEPAMPAFLACAAMSAPVSAQDRSHFPSTTITSPGFASTRAVWIIRLLQGEPPPRTPGLRRRPESKPGFSAPPARRRRGRVRWSCGWERCAHGPMSTDV
jgi:MFS family permease